MVDQLSRYDSIEEYITKDGSEIRELIHPEIHGNKGLSVAEAIIKAGMKTHDHYHRQSEEVYLVMAGNGIMRRGEEVFAITGGMSVVIMPGLVHGVHNNGNEELVIICCCAPAYGHDDTVLVHETD